MEVQVSHAKGILRVKVTAHYKVEGLPHGRVQPRFKSWGSNSTVQNKIRMVYPVSCTAVCYVTVITLFIKKVGVVRSHVGVRALWPPSGCALALM